MQKITKILNEGSFSHKTIKNIIQKRTENGINKALSTMEAFNEMYPDSETVFLKIYDVQRWKADNKCECGAPMDKYMDRVDRYKFRCRSCGRRYHPLSTSPLRGAHKDLNKILAIAYLMFNSKHGVSAKEISRMYGWKYATALKWAHRIRLWMSLQQNLVTFSEGIIELDEVYARIPSGMPAGYRYSRGPYSERVKPVITMVNRYGKAKAFVVDDVDSYTIRDLVQNNIVNTNSTEIHTDGARVYKFLSKENEYTHKECTHSRKEYARKDENDTSIHCNSNESLHALYKGMAGVVHKGVSLEKLNLYLQGVCWTFSQRHENALSAIESLFQALSSLHEKGKLIINDKN
jgi:transposase-like protein